MKIKLIITLIWIILSMLNSCSTQTINNMEEYDFKTMDSSSVNPLAIERNGWVIVMYKMDEWGASYFEFPPAPNFYIVGKTFYPNGKLKSKGKIVGQYLSIGIWQYYDEQGHLTKEVDEDRKFGRIKLNDILKFIDKEGHINLSTGEGREYAVIEEDKSGTIYYGNFSLALNEENSYWNIVIVPTRKNEFHRTTYHMDKDSGKILYKNVEQVKYIK